MIYIRYPLAKPYIGKEEERRVLSVLRSGVLSMGPNVEEFERRFARFVGSKYGCAVSSGTAGLHLALLCAGIREGDEVITSPFSFVASANAILYVGAKPVFVDIDAASYNIDPGKIEEKITAKTKAILIVHIFGQAADMDPIMKLAKKHRVKVIEDACESVGAVHKGKRVGTFGESAVFAFYPNKQMTTGEGGMIVTNDGKKDALFRSLRNQGRSADREWLNHERLGYNYRLDEMSAAVGLAQLRRIGFLLRERQKIAQWYGEFLSPYSALVRAPATAPWNKHAWFVYAVLIKNGARRDSAIKLLDDRGIGAKQYLPSIHLFDFYRRKFGFKKGDFPISESVSARSLALPFYVGLTRSDVKRICAALTEILS